MPKSEEVVQVFCDLMAKRDAEALRPFLADDAVYQNTGMEAAKGIQAVIENLAMQFSMFSDSYQYTTINCVSDGDLVMNERLDCIRGPSGTIHELPVMGTFVLKDGRISRWTDYWDTGLMGKMMSGEDTSALVPTY
jgi:limonene-1,2-epoxide hydrolase